MDARVRDSDSGGYSSAGGDGGGFEPQPFAEKPFAMGISSRRFSSPRDAYGTPKARRNFARAALPARMRRRHQRTRTRMKELWRVSSSYRGPSTAPGMVPGRTLLEYKIWLSEASRQTAERNRTRHAGPAARRGSCDDADGCGAQRSEERRVG